MDVVNVKRAKRTKRATIARAIRGDPLLSPRAERGAGAGAAWLSRHSPLSVNGIGAAAGGHGGGHVGLSFSSNDLYRHELVKNFFHSVKKTGLSVLPHPPRPYLSYGEDPLRRLPAAGARNKNKRKRGGVLAKVKKANSVDREVAAAVVEARRFKLWNGTYLFGFLAGFVLQASSFYALGILEAVTTTTTPAVAVTNNDYDNASDVALYDFAEEISCILTAADSDHHYGIAASYGHPADYYESNASDTDHYGVIDDGKEEELSIPAALALVFFSRYWVLFSMLLPPIFYSLLARRRVTNNKSSNNYGKNGKTRKAAMLEALFDCARFQLGIIGGGLVLSSVVGNDLQQIMQSLSAPPSPEQPAWALAARYGARAAIAFAIVHALQSMFVDSVAEAVSSFDDDAGNDCGGNRRSSKAGAVEEEAATGISER